LSVWDYTLAVALNYNGYSDWYLPSRDELDLLFRNLKQKRLGGFSEGNYWSSSESSSREVWSQRFEDGRQESHRWKTDPFSARAIRQF